MIVSKPIDRLYLQREKAQDIYVDLHSSLPQHQLDGIRFLYRQFKKKSPGVLLNDPSGYGKCLQVVLFLSALLPTLKNPVLVLTHAVDKWKEIFDQWTDFKNIAIRSANQFSKEPVFISPVEDGLQLSRRNWSVVVLHNDGHMDSTKSFLQMPFSAQYRIWISSKDMKENLRTLSAVYEWLYPQQKFNVANFMAKKNDWKDKLQKSIFLDAFLEDVLLRRSNFMIPVREMIETPSVKSPVKPTRKNKDPTGKKVKRSKKRKIDDDGDDLITPGDVFPNKISNINDNEMDVGNFIMNAQPISAKGFRDSIQDSSSNFDENSRSSKRSINVTVDVSENTKSQFGDIKNTKLHFGNVENTMLDLGEVVENKNSKYLKDVPLQFEKDKTHNEKDYCMEIAEIELDTSKIIVPETEESSDSLRMLHYSETQQTDNNMSIENLTRIDEVTGNKNVTVIPETEDSEDTQMYENETLKLDERIPNNITKTRDVNESKLSNKNIENESKDNINVKSNEIKINNGSDDDFETKLAELEAKALKKFKGSYLDSIF